MSGIDDPNPECPLCMEPLEMDDINFFPCTCGYQICRFCWHRIRTDENGLCPACRKQYPEDPADFKPLTQEELQRIKNEKRQKDLQRKQKISENIKHLANVRVVQKNLVFVVGLSARLADPEALKKHEYFGKFGKMHKVVINHSTAYAGSQSSGPSASAYVTYFRVEDALRAIQAVNNIHVDGRTLKASLGTTKYCSHFLKGQQCPKPDCMYLHELGDDAASFTKEEMQQGKHQEYEKKLHEQLFNNTRKQASSPILDNQPSVSGGNSCDGGSDGPRESWPTLPGDVPHTNGRGGGGGSSGGGGSTVGADSNGTSGSGKKSKSGSRHKNNGRKKHVSDEDNVRLKDTRSSEPSEGRAAIRNNIKTSQINALGGGGGNNGKKQNKKLSKNNKSQEQTPHTVSSSAPAAATLTFADCVAVDVVPPPPPAAPTKTTTAKVARTERPLPVPPAVANNHRPTPSPPSIGGGGGGSGTKGLLSSSPSSTPSPVSSLSSAGCGPLSSSPVSSPAQNFARLDCSSSSASSTSSSLSSSSADIVTPYMPDGPDACFSRSPGATSSSSSMVAAAASAPMVADPSRQAAGSSALDWLRSTSSDSEEVPVAQNLPSQSNTDWQAAFGFSSSPHSKDDDLGFDPWDESSKALADMIEKETRSGGESPLVAPPHFHCNSIGGGGVGVGGHSLPPRLSGMDMGHMSGVPMPMQHMNHHHPHLQQQQAAARRLGAPPGFAPNHMSNPYRLHRPMPTGPHQMQPTIMNRPPHLYNDPYLANVSKSNHMKELHGNHLKNHDTLNMKEWQDNLRALLPNINITFGASTSHPPSSLHKGWNVPNPSTEVPWVAHDPAVVSAGGVTDGGGVLSESQPHWMKSLQQLTEVDQHPVSYNGHRIPMVNHFSYRHPQWSAPAQIPPPGFGNPLGPSVIRPTEPQKLLDNF